MNNCELTQSYKIPLKSCQNSMIDHNLVTIWLSVEWAEKGDEPSLVIDITNKQPSVPCFQQNPPSLLVNSAHHHQHQENLGQTYQQQYHQSSGLNNYDPSNSTIANSTADHNDVSSMTTTTTTVVYNSLPPQHQASKSSIAIQKIKSDLQSPFLSMLRCQPPSNQSCLSSQHVIQAPSNDLNDSRLLSMNPTSLIKQTPSVIIPYFDLQQPSTMPCPPSTSNNLQLRSLICTCPNPTSFHALDCAIYSSSNQESNMNFSSDSMHRPLSMNRANIQRLVPAPPTHINSTMSIPSTKESMITPNLMSFPNSHLMESIDPSSSVTTIISQPPSFLNNPSVCSTIKLPSMNATNNFQQLSFNPSQIIINNQPNYPINPSIPMPMIGEQTVSSTKTRPRKKSTPKRNKQANKNLNNAQQNAKPPSLLSSPIVSQQGMFIHQDNSKITDNTLPGSMNDSRATSTQQSTPQTNKNIRSPVELLNIRTPENTNQTKNTLEVVDETITEVLQGKGSIPTHKSSTPSVPPQKTKQPLSSQIVWESNGPVTTKTYVSPLHQEQQSSISNSNTSTSNGEIITHITGQGVFPSITEQSQMNNTKKRVRSKPMSNEKPKRTTKSKIDVPQIKTSPGTPKSNIGGKPSSWSDALVSSSSVDSAKMTSIGLSDHYPINDSLEMPEIDHDLFTDPMSNTEGIQIIPTNDQHHGIDIDYLFSPKNEKNFNSSTPPSSLVLMPSTTNQLLNELSLENSSDTSNVLGTNATDIYEEFLAPFSEPTREEYPVTSTVTNSSDPQNNYPPEQQSYSQNDLYFDTNLQTQTYTSQYPERNFNNLNSMNNNDDVQRSSKQPTKPSKSTKNQSSKKLSKQRNRPNPIKKKLPLKPTCTRCGLTRLIDITQHEFPKQKGLVFECASCGNNSIRSNVSADERKRRLAKIAADHLNKIECQFCHAQFHSHDDYINHLKIDHESVKPM